MRFMEDKNVLCAFDPKESLQSEVIKFDKIMLELTSTKLFSDNTERPLIVRSGGEGIHLSLPLNGSGSWLPGFYV